VTPSKRRIAVTEATEAAQLSERRACRFTGYSLSTQRYHSIRPSEHELRQRLRELAEQRPRSGYRRLGSPMQSGCRFGLCLNSERRCEIHVALSFGVSSEVLAGKYRSIGHNSVGDRLRHPRITPYSLGRRILHHEAWRGSKLILGGNDIARSPIEPKPKNETI